MNSIVHQPHRPRRSRTAGLIAAFLACLFSVAAPAESFPARVVDISAGDIFEIAHQGTRELVVLYGVDAPSTATLIGKQAKTFAEQRVLNQPVTVRIVQRREGMTLVEFTLPDGSNLSHLMLRNGLAQWDSLSAPEDKGLQELQRLAENERLGMWSHPSSEAKSQAAPKPPTPGPPSPGERTLVQRPPAGGAYRVVESRVVTDEKGVKTLVLRGTGEKAFGFEAAAEQRRIEQEQARLAELERQRQELVQRQAEARQQWLEQQQRLEQQRREQLQLQTMQMLNEELRRQRPGTVAVTPLGGPTRIVQQ